MIFTEVATAVLKKIFTEVATTVLKMLFTEVATAVLKMIFTEVATAVLKLSAALLFNKIFFELYLREKKIILLLNISHIKL